MWFSSRILLIETKFAADLTSLVSGLGGRGRGVTVFPFQNFESGCYRLQRSVSASGNLSSAPPLRSLLAWAPTQLGKPGEHRTHRHAHNSPGSLFWESMVPVDTKKPHPFLCGPIDGIDR